MSKQQTKSGTKPLYRIAMGKDYPQLYFKANSSWKPVPASDADQLTHKQANAIEGKLRRLGYKGASMEIIPNPRKVENPVAVIVPTGGNRIAWLDSANMPSHIHRTLDNGKSTVCGHKPMDFDWTITSDVPRTHLGEDRHCRVCFKNTKKSIPFLEDGK
jgi:hypothetical protein